MLDMGFEPQIKRIIGEIPAEQRQTLFFTATWSKSVQKMAVKYLRSSGDLVNITVGSTEELVANTMVHLSSALPCLSRNPNPKPMDEIASNMHPTWRVLRTRERLTTKAALGSRLSSTSLESPHRLLASRVATVSRTKELKKRYGAKREPLRLSWKLCDPCELALLSASLPHLSGGGRTAGLKYDTTRPSIHAPPDFDMIF